jgi:hypothetical protein
MISGSRKLAPLHSAFLATNLGFLIRIRVILSTTAPPHIVIFDSVGSEEVQGSQSERVQPHLSPKQPT